MAKQDIEYTAKALGQVQTDLVFATTEDVLEYYFYQRIQSLRTNTTNNLIVGADTTYFNA